MITPEIIDKVQRLLLAEEEEHDVRELRRVQGSLPGAKLVIADCGMTEEARGLADYLAVREENAAVVNGADFRLE